MESKAFMPFYHDVQLCDKIWWGKHKGLLLYQIIEKDTGYVNWCLERIENFHLSCEAFDYLIEMENKIPKEEFRELCERVAVGDFSLNAAMKAKYTFEQHQPRTSRIIMNTLQTIPTSFEGLSKSQISLKAKTAVEYILEHGGAPEVAEIITSMETFIKEVRANKDFIEYVREEAAKNGGKLTLSSGTKIEVCEAGTKYDYSQDGKWLILKQAADRTNAELKEHEDKLKKVPSGKLLVDEETGEIMTGPSKTSTSSFKVSLAK
jgi:hypothetical protein